MFQGHFKIVYNSNFTVLYKSAEKRTSSWEIAEFVKRAHAYNCKCNNAGGSSKNNSARTVRYDDLDEMRDDFQILASAPGSHISSYLSFHESTPLFPPSSYLKRLC